MANQQPTDGQQQFGIQKIFIKDASFETSNAPAIFLAKWEPEINLQLGSKTSTINEGVYEVVLSLTVTAQLGDKTAYLVEVHQAGVFVVQGFNEREAGGMLGSYCPNLLFPFAREAVADLIGKGGFPPLYLAPVNFDALYAQQLQQHAQAAPATPQ